jgi:hypothetical protein
MINGKVSVSGTDRSGTLKKLLDGISRMEVYVGIPEEKADREGGGPSNAQLAFIHTHGARAASMRREMAGEMDKGQSYSAAHQLYVSAHGSPLYRVPPRPIIEPAIEAEGNKEPIAEELGAAAKAVLDRKPAEAKRHLTKAGMLGQNAARGWFTDPRNEWPPLAWRTLLRKMKRTKGMKRVRQALIRYVHEEGLDLAQYSALSNRPLIDTGELRRSITYVVKEQE